MTSDVTYLGKVVRVDSGSVEVELSNEIPSAAPIINGRLYKIGQIGTFVKIPIGNIIIYGIVSSVSNTPSNIKNEQVTYDFGSRFLNVQLIGEKIGDDDFERGVGTYLYTARARHPAICRDPFHVPFQSLFSVYQSQQRLCQR